MKKTVVFFLGFFLALYTSAQVPGFLGHRLSINTSVHTGPDLFGKDVSSTNKDRSRVAFNKRFSAGIDYILARRWSVAASFHFQNTATNKFLFDNSIEDRIGKVFSYGVNSNGFSISLSRFITKHNDFIAPVGRYYSFGIIVSNYTLIDVEGHVFAPNTKIASGSVAGLTVGFGRKRVFFKRVLVDYGIEAAGFFYAHSLKQGDLYNEFITSPRNRIKEISAINLKISIGYFL